MDHPIPLLVKIQGCSNIPCCSAGGISVLSAKYMDVVVVGVCPLTVLFCVSSIKNIMKHRYQVLEQAMP
jgi:hypothetical protein